VTSRSRWISDLHWVREGRQSRSQKTQESLLDAAEILFAEKGADATSVADVAAHAGCSVGAVYHHFRDKKALLRALFERLSLQLQATTREAVDPERWEGASVVDVLRSYLEFSLETNRERPGFKRAGLEAARSDPVLRARFSEQVSELYQGLAELVLARREEIGHPDPRLATSFVLDQLGSMLKPRLDPSLMPTRLATRSDEEFVREALRSACAYLGIPNGIEPDA
jgi:AcrR family transcriptional regulator